MSQKVQEQNPLIEQLDVLGDLLNRSTESSSTGASPEYIQEHPEMVLYLASVKESMEKFQHRASELSNECLDSTVATKKGLGRITYGLFALGIAMTVIANMLLVTVSASLLQLAMCNFGTMIIFVLAGVCLLSDVSNRDRLDGTQPIDIHHQIRSISDNVDQLSRLTYDWNKKLQELDQKKEQSQLAIQTLDFQEQELATRVEHKENELQQLLNEFENQQNENVATKHECDNLQNQKVTIVKEIEINLGEKLSVEKELESCKRATQTIQTELVAYEASIANKRREVTEIDAYSSQVQSDIMGIQKQILQLECISISKNEEISEMERSLKIIQDETDTLSDEKILLQAKISELEASYVELCACELPHRDLNSIRTSIELAHGEIELLDNSRTSLERVVNNLESEKNALATSLDTLRAEFQEQSCLVARKTEYLDALAIQEAQIQEKIIESTTRLAALQSQEVEHAGLAECEALLQTKRQEMIYLQARTESLRDEVYAQGREASELQMHLESLHALEAQTNVKFDAELLRHKLALEEKLSVSESLEAQIITSQENLGLAEADLTALRIEVNAAQLAANASQDLITDLQVQLAVMDTDQVRKAGQLVLLDKQLDLKLAEINSIEQLIDEAKARELTFISLCQDAEVRIAVLADKSEGLADHLGTMTANIEKLGQQREQAEKAVAQLDTLLSEKSELLNSLDVGIDQRETQIEDLQNAYATKNELYSNKLQELDLLEQKIRESESSVDTLNVVELKCVTFQKEIEVLQREIEQLVKQKEEAIEESNRIHASIQIARNRLDDNEKTLQYSFNEVLAAETKRAQTTESQCLLQAESHQLTVAINASKAKLATLASEIELTNREREELIQVTHRLQQECNELSNAKASLDLIQNDIQLRIAADRRTLAESESNIARAADLHEEIRKLESTVDETNRQWRVLTERVKSLEHECLSKENERDGILAELKRFENSAMKSEKVFAELNQKCETAKIQLVEIETRKTSARKELDQSEQKSAASKLAVDAITRELSVIEMNRSQAQSGLQQLSAEVVEAQTVCRQWQEYGEMLKRTNQELDASQKTLERQVQSLQVEHKNTECALQQNVLAVKNAALQRDKLFTEIESLEGKRRDFVHSEDALKHSLESKRTLLNELDTELNRSRMNVDATTLEFEQLRLKCKTEKGLLAELVAQHDELLREISNRSQLHEQQTRRCDDLKSQEQVLGMKLVQMKEKIQIFQEQEKLYLEKQSQWEALDATCSKKSLEMENLQHGIIMNREQIKADAKALSDYQAELRTNRQALEELLGKLNQSKLQFTRESGQQEAVLANLSTDVQSKQIELQNINKALLSTNEKLVQAEKEFESLSAQWKEAEINLASTASQNSALRKATDEMEASILVSTENYFALESKRAELLATMDVIEKQMYVSQAEKSDLFRSHLELKAQELSLVECCKTLEAELHSKQKQLMETNSQIGAREQQLVETLQAITLIGQQRENAMARLESDREMLEQSRREIDLLQIQRLESESSILHFSSEAARMSVSRDRLTEELRLLESQRQLSLEEVLSIQAARDTQTSDHSDVVNDPAGQNVEDSLEVELLSEILDVVQTIGEQPQDDDVWGDLLRVVRVA